MCFGTFFVQSTAVLCSFEVGRGDKTHNFFSKQPFERSRRQKLFLSVSGMKKLNVHKCWEIKWLHWTVPHFAQMPSNIAWEIFDANLKTHSWSFSIKDTAQGTKSCALRQRQNVSPASGLKCMEVHPSSVNLTGALKGGVRVFEMCKKVDSKRNWRKKMSL